MCSSEGQGSLALPGVLGFPSLVGCSELRGWEGLRDHQPSFQFTDGKTKPREGSNFLRVTRSRVTGETGLGFGALLPTLVFSWSVSWCPTSDLLPPSFFTQRGREQAGGLRWGLAVAAGNRVVAPGHSTWGRQESVFLMEIFFFIVIEYKIEQCLQFHNVGSSSHMLLTVLSSF